MWRTFADWFLAVLNMSRELQEHRATIRRLEERQRDMEEGMKLLAMELRHARELENSEREKLLLRLEPFLTKPKELPAAQSKQREA
jgi:hypothetical protein